jgi:hypothetical protein
MAFSRLCASTRAGPARFAWFLWLFARGPQEGYRPRRFFGVGAIGRKASPGPLFGIANDLWSALAIAVTYPIQSAD